MVYSTKATVQELTDFVNSVVKLEKVQSNILTVYRPLSYGGAKNPEVMWDCVKFRSNKTMENTILASEVEKKLFDDIEWFMDNEQWYTDKGIDYKRGYMLFGIPGTGKTSSIKAIANRYRLPIFNLDFDTISNNSQLISLTNEIVYKVGNKPYILSIEDLDRHDMFQNKRSYNNKESKVTIQCLLNVIDGVVETHGRILFITCNNKYDIEQIRALVRPGRIDSIVEIGPCDGEQASRLINNYFGTDLTIEDSNMNRPPTKEPWDDQKDGMTPAELIKKMQFSMSLEKTLQYVCKDTSQISGDSTIKDFMPSNIVLSADDDDDDESASKLVPMKRRRRRKPRTVVDIKKGVVDRIQRQIDRCYSIQQRNLRQNKNLDYKARKLAIDLEMRQDIYEKTKLEWEAKQAKKAERESEKKAKAKSKSKGKKKATKTSKTSKTSKKRKRVETVEEVVQDPPASESVKRRRSPRLLALESVKTFNASIDAPVKVVTV